MSIFNDQYNNAFDSIKPRSLQEQKAVDSLNKQLSSNLNAVGLPSCHLNFSNLGNFDFSWSSLTPTPVDYKLFNKIERLSYLIKKINDLLISMIEEFKCCNVAETYNKTVIPIFEWLLKDFVNTLVSIAKNLMIGYQAVKAIECVTRPIPGNPWLKSGGYDWLNFIYSYIDGFESMFDWIMDGNVLDVLLNPIEDFYKKAASCSPSGSFVSNGENISTDRLQQLLDSYNLIDKQKQNLDKKALSEKQNAYDKINNEIHSLMIQIDTLKTADQLAILNGKEPTNINQIKSFENQINTLTTDPAYKEITTINNLNKKGDLTLQRKINNQVLVQSTIDKLIVDENNPTCSCLFGILGLSGYNPPKFVTVHTKQDVISLLHNKVAYADKGKWQANVDRARKNDINNPIQANELNNIYISYNNIAEKYSKSNSTVDRNLDIVNLFTNYNTLDLEFAYTDYMGITKNNTFTIDAATAVSSEFNILYIDSGKTTHKSTNILTIFELNQKRLIEENALKEKSYTIKNNQRELEHKMESLWNDARRAAISALNIENYHLKNDSTYNGLNNIILQQSILRKLGTSFNIVSFIKEFDNSLIAGVDNLKLQWEADDFLYNQLKVMQTRLSDLIQIDNVVIKIVDTKSLCGCDIICKLLQWALDIIISVVKAMIKAIEDKITKSVMNEHVKYIIDLIMYYAQCALDISKISKNIETIKNKSDALTQLNKQPLNKMTDYAYCNTQKNVSDITKTDKIDLSVGTPPDFASKDTIIIPDPRFGVPGKVVDNNGNSIKYPGNTIINNGAITGGMRVGRTIPEMILNCDTTTPNIILNLKPVDVFEIIIIFEPSNYINTALIEETPQVIYDAAPTVTDSNGVVQNVKNDIIPKVNRLSEVMKAAQATISAVQDAPIYIKTDCSTDTALLKLCSTANLKIDFIQIIQNDIVVTDSSLGVISPEKTVLSNDTLYEYYPESNLADSNGLVKMVTGDRYYTYTIRDVITTINTPVIVTSTVDVPAGTDQTPHSSTNLSSNFNNFIKYNTETKTDITFNTVGGVLQKTTVITTTVTEYDAFRYPNLEFLIRYKNLVNHLDVRLILDVVNDLTGSTDSAEPYIASSYNGRYLNFVELGKLDSSNKTFIISEKRLLFLSSQLLTDNYLITDPRAVANKVKNTAPSNDCLLPEPSNKDASKIKSIIQNIDLSNNKLTSDITSALVDIPSYTTTNSTTKNKISSFKTSIPLLVLNTEYDVVVQIVNKKIYFQFKTNSLLNSDPYIIDCELIPGEQYAFSFKSNNLLFDLSLITPDKKKYSVNGINTSGAVLLPSVVGGNTTGTSSFCGKIIDIILSKTGNYTDDYYVKSMMSYVPRTAGILFDFKVSNGNKVFNTITQAGSTFVKNNNMLVSQDSVTAQSMQKATFYGNIKSNAYYQVLDGMMDNFFCKENLVGKNFTISFWLWNKGNLLGRHMIISDDINHNYIYWDNTNSRLVVSIGDTEDYIYFTFDKWCLIQLSHNLFTNKYVLSVNLGVKKTKIIIDPIQFHFMSLLAEYDYNSKQYINKFDGLIGAVTIYNYAINDSEYNTLYNEQRFLMRGMEL